MKKLIFCFTIIISIFYAINVFGYYSVCGVCSSDVWTHDAEWYQRDLYKDHHKKINGKMVNFGSSYIFCNDCYDKYYEGFHSCVTKLETEYLENLTKEYKDKWKAYHEPRDRKELERLKKHIDSDLSEISEIKERMRTYGVDPDTIQIDNN